jgi:hypothetical protein
MLLGMVQAVWLLREECSGGRKKTERVTDVLPVLQYGIVINRGRGDTYDTIILIMSTNYKL